jgi:hypothetical protein
MNFINRIIITFIIALSVLSPIEVAFAARISDLNVDNRNDFVLEPGKIEIFINPGETTTRNISVINRINRKVDFLVETEDFIGSDNVNTPVILLGSEKSPYSFKDNLIPESNSFDLKFGQKIELPISITAPEDAQPGGYYSSVIVSSLPADEDDGASAGAKIVSRVAVLFFVRVNGPVNQQGQLDDFRIEGGDSFMQKGPVNFEILFKNEGTVHLVPYGTVRIKNIFGREVGKVPVDAYFSLPESLRYRQVTWAQERLLGRYTAELTLNRGYEGKEDVSKIAFWVIPWTYIVAVLAAILLLTLLWKFITSKFEFKRKAD